MEIKVDPLYSAIHRQTWDALVNHADLRGRLEATWFLYTQAPLTTNQAMATVGLIENKPVPAYDTQRFIRLLEAEAYVDAALMLMPRDFTYRVTRKANGNYQVRIRPPLGEGNIGWANRFNDLRGDLASALLDAIEYTLHTLGMFPDSKGARRIPNPLIGQRSN